jgi:NAD(P)-dependent dehydrogenase (short-subunit alcohol dehydrogenase family)
MVGSGVVHVTGAASGIGRCVAELFEARGSDVVLFDRRPCDAALTAVSQARRSGTQRVDAHELDVIDAAGGASAPRAASERLGRPSLVFQAAGIGGYSRRFEEFAPERFAELVTVNLLGSRNVAAAALPLLERGGTLALVASLAGLVPAFGQAGYAAAKHGVVGLAGVLRIEAAPRGIRVCVVCPPEVDTVMARDDAATRPPETTAMKLFAGSLPLEAACREIVAGVLRGRFLVVPGRRARATWALQKILPRAVTDRIADRMVARVQRSC